MVALGLCVHYRHRLFLCISLGGILYSLNGALFTCLRALPATDRFYVGRYLILPVDVFATTGDPGAYLFQLDALAGKYLFHLAGVDSATSVDRRQQKLQPG